jgi:chemotaxis signal transduction protein
LNEVRAVSAIETVAVVGAKDQTIALLSKELEGTLEYQEEEYNRSEDILAALESKYFAVKAQQATERFLTVGLIVAVIYMIVWG